MKKIIVLFFVLGFLSQVIAQSPSEPLFSYQIKKAISAFQKELEKGDSTNLVAYADALFVTGQMDLAYKNYRIADKKGVLIGQEQQRNYVHAALRLEMESPYFQRTDYFSQAIDLDVVVEKMTINSDQEDLNPFYRNGQLIFSSSRYAARNKNKFRYPLTNLPYLDIYVADTLGNILAENDLPSGLQTDYHDGPVYLTEDSTLFFVTRTRSQADKNGIHQLYITYYTRENGKWSNEQEFPFNNKLYSVQHPWFDQQESCLYFASDQTGGAGGFDLYRSKFSGGQWLSPERLSDEINTPFDEVFPSIDPEGNLLYASNHLETRGGLDLVLYRGQKRLLLPEPLNSKYDDFGLSWQSTWRGYFSTNRSGVAFNDDLYAFEGAERIEPKFKQFIEILVAEERKPFEAEVAGITLFSDQMGDSLSYTQWTGMQHLGTYTAPWPEWNIRVMAKGYYPVSGALRFEQQGDSLVATIWITKKKAVLEAKGYLAIYFQNGEPGKMTKQEEKMLDYRKFFDGYLQSKPDYFTKSASSAEELEVFFDEVTQGMKELELFPARLDTVLRSGGKMRVYMAAYTSASGSAAINKIISERRGAVLKNFIVNWNNGALQKYIDNGQLTVSDEYFPMSADDAKVKTGGSRAPAYTIYGVPASRNRRVNVVWETLDAGNYDD